MDTISITLRKQAYKLVRSAHQNPLFQGTLEQVTEYRAFLKSTYSLQASYEVTWSDNKFAALALEKTQDPGLPLIPTLGLKGWTCSILLCASDVMFSSMTCKRKLHVLKKPLPSSLVRQAVERAL